MHLPTKFLLATTFFATTLLLATTFLASEAFALEERQNLGTNCHCYNSVLGDDWYDNTQQVCRGFGGIPTGTMIGCNCWCEEGCSAYQFNLACGYLNPVAAGECDTIEHTCPWDHE